MNKLEKQEEVVRLRQCFESYDVVVFAHSNGLNVSASRALRKAIRAEAGGICFVAKNTLAKIAIKGTRYEGLSDLLSGPVSIVCGYDSIAVSKSLMQFCNDDGKLKVIGAVIDDKRVDSSYVEMLSSIPSFEELRARLVFVLNSPASQLVRVLKARVEQQQ